MAAAGSGPREQPHLIGSRHAMIEWNNSPAPTAGTNLDNALDNGSYDLSWPVHASALQVKARSQ